jgi:hypothetical protein
MKEFGTWPLAFSKTLINALFERDGLQAIQKWHNINTALAAEGATPDEITVSSADSIAVHWAGQMRRSHLTMNQERKAFPFWG